MLEKLILLKRIIGFEPIQTISKTATLPLSYIPLGVSLEKETIKK